MKDNKNIDSLLDEALKTPVNFMLSGNFAMRMARKIELRKLANDKKIMSMQYYAMAAFCIPLLILLAIFTDKDTFGFLSNAFGWIAVFGAMLVIFQVIEHKMLTGKGF